ncbi:MAG: hypothetical protein ACK56I_16200, partial [bacterium]
LLASLPTAHTAIYGGIWAEGRNLAKNLHKGRAISDNSCSKHAELSFQGSDIGASSSKVFSLSIYIL